MRSQNVWRNATYWFTVVACGVGGLAGVAELVVFHRYVFGLATIVVACLVIWGTYRRREFFRRPSMSLDEMKAITRGTPNTKRIQLTAFAILVSLGGIAGVVFAAYEITKGALGMGLLLGVASAFFALFGGFGAVAMWLPKNRPRAG